MSSESCKWCGSAIDGSRGQYTSLTYECGTYNAAADGGLRWTQSRVCSRLTQLQDEKRPSAEAVQAAVEAICSMKQTLYDQWLTGKELRDEAVEAMLHQADNAIAGLTGGEG